MTREEAIAAMEALQKLSCGYLPGGVCDCKYGLKPEILKCENYGRSVSRPMDERTGCPELRDMKALLEAMSDEAFERFLCMSNGMTPSEEGAEGNKVIEFSEPVELPDGSGFMTGKFPLPKDHWIYEESGEPPMPMQMGVGDPVRMDMTEKVRVAAQYALRCATMSGEDMDFDPDAVIQELIVGLFGYHTKDGSEGGELVPKCPKCRARMIQESGAGFYELRCPECGHEERG